MSQPLEPSDEQLAYSHYCASRRHSGHEPVSFSLWCERIAPGQAAKMVQLYRLREPAPSASAAPAGAGTEAAPAPLELITYTCPSCRRTTA